MSQVFDCADKATELPFFSIAANSIIEHLLEVGFHIVAYASSIGNQIIIDVSTFGNIGRVICDHSNVSAVGFHSSESFSVDITDPDSFNELTKFFKAANHSAHGQIRPKQ